ncbi:MAG: mannose-1-phosphate guanylyltransferase, partial [Planctomycetota bacterium]
RLLTFCIEPDRPATGFGYVEKGEPVELGEQAARIVQEERSRNDRPRTEPLVFRVKRFVEKPDLERAKEYLRSGRFGWNSGMFVWRAQTILDAIEAYKPAVRQGLEEIAQAWGTKAQDETLARVYPTLEKISVDYAVMEPASTDERFEALTVVMDLQWRDIGSWPAYAQTLEPDEAGNRVAGGQARLLDCSGVLAVSDEPDHLIAAIGLSDVVIVRTRDATLVMPAERAEQLKQLHRTLPEELQ